MEQINTDNNDNNDVISLRRSPLELVTAYWILELLITGLHFVLRQILEEFVTLLDIAFWGMNFGLVEIIVVQIINLFVLSIIFIRWYYNYYKISSDSLQIINGFFRKDIKSFDTTSIQEIKVEQGIMGRIFNYGNIIIKNPAWKKSITLVAIPNPYYTRKVLQNPRKQENQTTFLRT